MFLCKKCLEKNYEPVMFSLDSTGTCEICKNIDRCVDAPSSFLRKRKLLTNKYIGNFDDNQKFKNKY